MSQPNMRPNADPRSPGSAEGSQPVSMEMLRQAVPFFRDLPEGQLHDLGLLATLERYPANTTIRARPDRPARVYLLVDGLAQVFEIGTGGERQELALAGSQETPNGVLLFDETVSSLALETRQSSRFLAFEREGLLDFLAGSPRLIPRLLTAVRGPQAAVHKLLCDALDKQAFFAEREREQYRLLAQIPLAANESDTVDGALQIALDRICTGLGWSVGHVYRTEEGSSGGLFSLPVWHLSPAEQFEMFQKISDVSCFTAGVDLPGRALANRGPIWISDLAQLFASARAKAACHSGLQSAFAVPIPSGKKVWGVMEFFSLEAHPTDHYLLEFMMALAAQLGRVVERKQYEQQLVHNAFHDSLTGLPNRAVFLDHLNLSLARSKRNKEYLFAVLFLDLDRFKIINDSLGHLLGDRVLTEVASRIHAVLRTNDTVARFGGDEFAILLDDLGEMSNVPRTVERIRKELQAPIQTGEREVFTSASIGVVLSSADYESAENILQDSDIALYHAKQQGRSRFVIFDSAMRERVLRTLQVETELRQALERRELRVFYQPIVSLENGRIVSFEALLRWQHPQRGLIAAGEFLPVAEETEIILPISQWILHEVCQQLRGWQQQFPSDPPLSVSVNLTSKYLAKPDLVEEIMQAIEENHLDPRSLRLEITESQIMEDPAAVSKTLMELGQYGVQVSIDDFGTGYSSLSYLSSFRVQALKIDYSFINKLNGENRDAAIVRAVVGLGLNLGLEVVAEGVERPDQLDFLRTVQCQYAQGYYFCKPLDQQSADRLLGERARLDREQPVEASRLRAFDLFRELDDAELAGVAQLARERMDPAGTVVIRQGQVGKEVYLLEEGLVEVFREHAGANQLLAELSAPAFFGERVLLDPDRVRTASVKALSDLRLLVIGVDSFLGCLRRFPSLKEKLRGVFVERS